MSHHGTGEGNDRNRRAECGWCWHPALISWLLSQNGGGLLPTPALCLKLFFFSWPRKHPWLQLMASWKCWSGRECAWTQPWVLGKGGKGENENELVVHSHCSQHALQPARSSQVEGAQSPLAPNGMIPLLALASPPSLLTSPLYNCYFLGPPSPLTLNFPCLNPCLPVCF